MLSYCWARKPPRSPLGVFKAFIVTRTKGIYSLREMTRLLDVHADTQLRRLCHNKPSEKGYPRSVLSRFIRKVREDRLARIVKEKVVKLLKRNEARDADALFDASFIKAWSTRHPPDSQRGFSDGDARVLRAGRMYASGYKLHLAIDSKTMLPLTYVVASANQNEQKHSLSIVEKTKLILKQSAAKLRSIIADSQYSDAKLRNAADKTVIPPRANQKPETRR